MDLICYCHLRWNFVYQRPQHLISRFAKNYRTFYFEEPIFSENQAAYYILEKNSSVTVVIPHLPYGLNEEQIVDKQQLLLQDLVMEYNISDHIAWYYTPMALNFSRFMKPGVVVYDCMDELSNFKFAPTELKDLELELFSIADIVSTRKGHTRR